ncbi:MAG TPA: small multi-drug resistant family protein [Chromatiaceae bacterium]|jgi:drug/metabolite transporter (DMT)-like permease|nr:small multi-drug resistant family protein [Chromatiaceae bacterium]HIN81787.1 small multi-drug resistant family protein [Chromatiales bacterium]HIO02575.1 small multi-drug resistant family protein [Alphaproteobacteria bacterium]HIA08918.1 small multi-drug resistant family protein [Chromatiaceae bacterium]HIB85457.1 small multi-drug resistant family protein [Chromatiaceae bacterium]
MTISVFILILVSVAISALAQISLKAGMSAEAIQLALDSDTDRLDTITTIASNPYVLGGLGLYGFGAILWLLVLARIDVSMAYPFVGLGFILTMVFASLFLNEQLTLVRIAGTMLVVSGVFLVAKS